MDDGTDEQTVGEKVEARLQRIEAELKLGPIDETANGGDEKAAKEEK